MAAAVCRSGSELSGRVLLEEIVCVEVKHLDPNQFLFAPLPSPVSLRKDLHPNWIHDLADPALSKSLISEVVEAQKREFPYADGGSDTTLAHAIYSDSLSFPSTPRGPSLAIIH
jgi:hypothetical protein